MKYAHLQSLLPLFASLFLLQCCARVITENPHQEHLNSLRITKTLVEKYGEIHSNTIENYLHGIAARLLMTSSAKNYQGKVPPIACTFTILATDIPVAYTLTQGSFIFSHGLLRSVRTEGELVFVIAHELSHALLRHPEELLHNELNSKDILVLEQTADTAGVQMMIESGYNPHDAEKSLISTYQALYGTPLLAPSSDASTYPSLGNRIETLRAQITSSGLSTSGISDTREFWRFQHALNEYAARNGTPRGIPRQ